MIATVDIGNTNIKIGLYEGSNRIAFTRFLTVQEDYSELVDNFMQANKIGQLDDIMISCVVPKLKKHICKALKPYCNNEPISVNCHSDLGIGFEIPEPETIGGDILVMCSYAYHLLKRECIIISFGTATVLCHVNEKGNFSHCILAPGYEAFSKLLSKNTAQLPDIKYSIPDTVLVNNTEDAINVGVVTGYIGLCSHLLEKMKTEIANPEIYVLGIGGVGKLFVNEIKSISEYSPDFVSDGLAYLYTRCK